MVIIHSAPFWGGPNFLDPRLGEQCIWLASFFGRGIVIACAVTLGGVNYFWAVSFEILTPPPKKILNEHSLNEKNSCEGCFRIA